MSTWLNLRETSLLLRKQHWRRQIWKVLILWPLVPTLHRQVTKQGFHFLCFSFNLLSVWSRGSSLFSVLHLSAVCLLLEYLVGWCANSYFLRINMRSSSDASESEIPKTKGNISQASCKTGLKMGCVQSGTAECWLEVWGLCKWDVWKPSEDKQWTGKENMRTQHGGSAERSPGSCLVVVLLERLIAVSKKTA